MSVFIPKSRTSANYWMALGMRFKFKVTKFPPSPACDYIQAIIPDLEILGIWFKLFQKILANSKKS